MTLDVYRGRKTTIQPTNQPTNQPFSIWEKEFTLNYPKSASGGFSKELKNKFETAVVNEPSVFEPLKFYYIHLETDLLIMKPMCFLSDCF